MTQARVHKPDVGHDAAHVIDETPEDLWTEVAALLRKHKGKPGPGRQITVVITLDDDTGAVIERNTHVVPPRVYVKKRAS